MSLTNCYKNAFVIREFYDVPEIQLLQRFSVSWFDILTMIVMQAADRISFHSFLMFIVTAGMRVRRGCRTSS